MKTGILLLAIVSALLMHVPCVYSAGKTQRGLDVSKLLTPRGLMFTK